MQRRSGLNVVSARVAPQDGGLRVVLSRESLWLLAVPEGPSQRERLQDRRGQLVMAGYAVYPGRHDSREFDAVVSPILRTLAASRTRSMLVLTETASSFDALRVRRAIQLTREVGLPSIVEVDGEWASAQLDVLAATGLSYLRLAPEMLRGAASVPDIFRALVSLGEFARERSLELVARNPCDGNELDALRAAGIGLVQWCALPTEPLGSVPVRPYAVARA